MKILLFTDGIYPFEMGGMQKHSFYLAKYLVKHNHEVTLVHCVDKNKSIPSNQEVSDFIAGSSNLKVLGFRFPDSMPFPGHYIYRNWLYSGLIYNHFKNTLNDYDLIYSQGFTAWQLLKNVRNAKKPPVIVNLHGLEMFQTSFSTKEKLQKFLLKIPAKYVIKHADFVQSLGGKLTLLLEELTAKSKVFSCGIGIDSTWMKQDLVSSSNIDSLKPLKFVFIGRYEKRKGIEVLNQALNLDESFKNELHIDFIGPIPREKQLIGNHIIYHGTINDENAIKTILSKADVLVVPSLSEGMPTVILEAMSMGLAILATDVGAVSELVNNGNGWLIHPNNSKSLFEHLKLIHQLNPELISQKKKASLSVVQTYNWSQKIEEYVYHFKSIIG
jgi:glycosyltransferase involved in cell wall biosynthesis